MFVPALTLDPQAAPRETAEAARLAEEFGFASLWTSGHLTGRCPMLDPLTVLATAAATTSRLLLGTATLFPALERLPGLAQRLATVQYLSGGRLLLGCDAGDSAWARWRGGSGDGAAGAAWRAAGVPYEERDARLDMALTDLPALLRGEPGLLDPARPDVALSVPADVPPLFVGGENEAALDRAVRFGDHWFPALASPDWLAGAVAGLRERAAAAGRAVPGVAVAQPFALGGDGAFPGTPADAAALARVYGFPEERVTGAVVRGGPRQAAERLAEFAAAGADHIVLSTYDSDWRKQYELLAEAVALLD
ncbi:hypothetical protein GCM10010218_41050 [Streptomyces mashuensis]|uniref:Luciferase-like domain-containing protein n=1 Tax=Streptomyces mashuensis TaxID=33904 RepID=A0A919B4J5_9ACTN|nr:hypothetical protein GCM10010218_41050 [Streptomyces mashuensis]